MTEILSAIDRDFCVDGPSLKLGSLLAVYVAHIKGRHQTRNISVKYIIC